MPPNAPARAAWLVASGLGSGCAPVAPGTVGSLAALLPGAVLLRWSPAALAVAAALALLLGLWAVPRAGGRDDPGWVVIDEFAGQWLTLCGLARLSLPGLLAAFVLFRLLDVTKPGPIGWADRQGGAVGVMLDDVLAGLVGAVLLWAVRRALPGVLDWGVLD